ncbi:type II toxin-antitoxin system PemK/MazF family toxin [Pseudanabaena sp. UWO310]|uniref:type II toxin-antitoxin system PemK/MazF family toxin n=1 Tax=Pseudanabaena sp. UWO310 TaxID=2480795 RepID=UPI001157E4B7|nr:type II toxin-antitoxin system PemK/MazF family toxin [Pseudanabaena sp. UWO310]TYQ31494.1 type II toxin-antitoxin system PemK/MazF family toxin [Pseudanabaena sp. UWO310]
MTAHILQIGDVITAKFPSQNPSGREQEGYRPAIVVGIPSRLGKLRFPLVFVVPMTTDRGQDWAANSPDLYVRFSIGIAGLKSPSIALLDQVRAIDISRIVAYRGSLTPQQYVAIAESLKKIMETK